MAYLSCMWRLATRRLSRSGTALDLKSFNKAVYIKAVYGVRDANIKMQIPVLRSQTASSLRNVHIRYLMLRLLGVADAKSDSRARTELSCPSMLSESS